MAVIQNFIYHVSYDQRLVQSSYSTSLSPVSPRITLTFMHTSTPLHTPHPLIHSIPLVLQVQCLFCSYISLSSEANLSVRTGIIGHLSHTTPTVMAAFDSPSTDELASQPSYCDTVWGLA